MKKMDKRKSPAKRSPHREGKSRNESARGFYTPFDGLDQHLEEIVRKKTSRDPGKVHPLMPIKGGGEERRVFLEEMRDVVPLAGSGKGHVPFRPPQKSPPGFLAQEELEAYTHLVDLVTGDAPFELTYSDEYIDGAMVGLSPKILKKLRRGEFSYQRHLDLHGLNKEQARPRVIEFVQTSFAQKQRCVLIVCGRGLNSLDKEPVLKVSLVKWLTQSPLKRLVLAFASARSYDGGPGAFYVLLRRNESGSPVFVPAP